MLGKADIQRAKKESAHACEMWQLVSTEFILVFVYINYIAVHSHVSLSV